MAPNYWMLPNKFGFDEDNDIIAEIPSINISLTIKNLTWVFESTGRQKQLKASNNVEDIRNQIETPGVKSYIFMCTGVNTIVKMLYNYNFSQSQLNESKETQVHNQVESQKDYWWKHEGVEIYGDGDNSVSVKSLRVPHLWKEKQKEPVIVKEYSGNGVDHSAILRDKKFLNDLSEILVGNKIDEGKEI
ncbi:MAG: hypothetical protein EZS28_002979 [Streblomastix strix]|uniref:Uncharacterized protein n=1 Tax=Streblomastix strix TaxID=222440 RepID=A0A5J4X435_9EUKA|nr:MAG: hypothetical protein EZS28_002979 [Streblomastix strix]